MGHVRCRFSSRQHTPLQQRSHHAGSPCRRQSSLATATLRLPRQFVGRYNLLLYRLPYHTRARTATLPHPSPAYATSPSSGTALGCLHGVFLLGSLSWRCHPCRFGHHAQQSPRHQCHHAPWPHASLRHHTHLGSRHSKNLLVTNRDMLSLDIPCPRG